MIRSLQVLGRVAAFGWVLALTSCGGSSSSAGDGVDTSQVSRADLSYANVNEKVFQESCVRCHGTSGGIGLETYTDVKANIDLVTSEVVNGDMPPSGALSSDLRALVQAWSDAGAPEQAPE